MLFKCPYSRPNRTFPIQHSTTTPVVHVLFFCCLFFSACLLISFICLSSSLCVRGEGGITANSAVVGALQSDSSCRLVFHHSCIARAIQQARFSKGVIPSFDARRMNAFALLARALIRVLGPLEQASTLRPSLPTDKNRQEQTRTDNQDKEAKP